MLPFFNSPKPCTCKLMQMQCKCYANRMQMLCKSNAIAMQAESIAHSLLVHGKMQNLCGINLIIYGEKPEITEAEYDKKLLFA